MHTLPHRSKVTAEYSAMIGQLSNSLEQQIDEIFAGSGEGSHHVATPESEVTGVNKLFDLWAADERAGTSEQAGQQVGESWPMQTETNSRLTKLCPV